MQALPFNSDGTASSSVVENRASLHQQSTSKRPAAETAQSLGLPQMGHSGACSGAWSVGLRKGSSAMAGLHHDGRSMPDGRLGHAIQGGPGVRKAVHARGQCGTALGRPCPDVA